MKYLFLAASMALTGAAHAAPTLFTDDYAVANWTSSPGLGAIDTSGAPGSVTLTSAATGPDGGAPFFTDFYIQVTHSAYISFDWLFETDDDPNFHDLGFLTGDSAAALNFNALTSGSAPDGGSAAPVFVETGDYFGFRMISWDPFGLSAFGTISSFDVNAIPEPNALMLACLALAAAGVVTQRRSRG